MFDCHWQVKAWEYDLYMCMKRISWCEMFLMFLMANEFAQHLPFPPNDPLQPTMDLDYTNSHGHHLGMFSSSSSSSSSTSPPTHFLLILHDLITRPRDDKRHLLRPATFLDDWIRLIHSPLLVMVGDVFLDHLRWL